MSRTLIAFGAAFLLALPASAQTIGDNYVELIVSDTVPVKLKSIAYDITVADPTITDIAYNDGEDYEKYQSELNDRMAKANDRLKKDLMGAGYVVGEGHTDSDPYTISGYQEPVGTPSSRVILKNEAELKKLVGWLRERGKVEGHVSEWNYDAEPGAMEALMTNLFAKAKAQAERLATLGGRKLGKLISAHDPQDREMTFKDFMRAIEDRGANESAAHDLQMRQRQMVFRFALTD
ncbi:MAG: SIMPL domain-containing protein [Flavobacteriales bacterium]